MVTFEAHAYGTDLNEIVDNGFDLACDFYGDSNFVMTHCRASVSVRSRIVQDGESQTSTLLYLAVLTYEGSGE